MQQSRHTSCEANRHSASEDISCLLRNPYIHDCVHKSPTRKLKLAMFIV